MLIYEIFTSRSIHSILYWIRRNNIYRRELMKGEEVMQYDYFTAYLDFYIGFPNSLKRNLRKISKLSSH